MNYNAIKFQFEVNFSTPEDLLLNIEFNVKENRAAAFRAGILEGSLKTNFLIKNVQNLSNIR